MVGLCHTDQSAPRSSSWQVDLHIPSRELTVRADAHNHCPIDSPIDQSLYSTGQWQQYNVQWNHEAFHRLFAVNRKFGASPSTLIPNHKTFHNPPIFTYHPSSHLRIFLLQSHILLQHLCFDTCFAFKHSRGIFDES